MALKHMGYMYPIFPIVAIIVMVLCILSTPPHWSHGNFAIVSLALWISIGLLICAINVCVWHGNTRDPFPLWCDFTQLYLSMLGTGICGCILCIQLRLHSVMSAKTIFITKRQKRRQKYIAGFLCFGIAILCGLSHYVTQGHRYDIIEDIGPVSITTNTTVSVVWNFVSAPLVSILSAIYAIRTYGLFLIHRKEIDKTINSDGVAPNRNRYTHLMALTGTITFISLPLNSWSFVWNALVIPVEPWISWAYTHSDYDRIGYTTRLIISTMPTAAVTLSISWWNLVLCGCFFVAFFGTGKEAISYYRPFLRRAGIKGLQERKKPAVQRSPLDIVFCRPGRRIPDELDREIDISLQMPQTETEGSGDLFASTYHAAASSGEPNGPNIYKHPNGIETVVEQIHGECSASMDSRERRSAGGNRDGNKPMGATNNRSSCEVSGTRNIQIDLEAQTPPLSLQLIHDEIICRDPELTEVVSF